MGRDANEPELPPSAYMLMGMIREGFDTGYRIKQRLERVASLFWSVSYGHIYPELRRFEAAGMLASRADSGRRVNGRGCESPRRRFNGRIGGRRLASGTYRLNGHPLVRQRTNGHIPDRPLRTATSSRGVPFTP